MGQPTSILTHRQRQHDRLTDAIAHVWNADHGAHRQELRAVQRLVDNGDMSVTDALTVVTDAQRQVSRQHAA